MLVALLIFKSSKNFANLTILLSCSFKGLTVNCYLNRTRNKCMLRVTFFLRPITYQCIGHNPSWLITQLCRLCYKYCMIGRYWLSEAFLQMVSFRQFCFWKSVLQWFLQAHFVCLSRPNQTTSSSYHWPIIASKLNSISFFKFGILLQQPIMALLEGSSGYFSNMSCTILKEMRGCEIFNFPE